MTDAEKQELRKRIEAEIETLKSSIRTLSELTDDDIQSDANDWFTTKEDTGKEINEVALAKSKQRLKVLSQLLERTDSQNFGICTVCKKPIPFKRLMAVPTTSRCMNCGRL